MIGSQTHIPRTREVAQTLMRFALIGVATIALSLPVNAQIFQTKAKQALMIDWSSGAVLFAKNEEERFQPASLAKLMTVEVVFNAIKSGELTLEDEFEISENAWRTGGANSGGSTMFAKLHSTIKLDDLLKGIIVQSGNDACIAIAEGMAGNEESFAQLMNNRAEALGLKNSNFTNSTGLPDEDQYVTAWDMSKLARHLIETYPDLYHYYSIPEFAWNGITQQNRNPLLNHTKGADGLKTGYIKASGYAVIASAKRKDQRLIAVMSGMKSKRERREETRKIVDWGFRAFVSKRLYDVDEEIAHAQVFGGDQSSVMLVSDRPLSLFMARSQKGRMKARVHYDGPLKAPLDKGEKVATLKVWQDDRLMLEAPLVTGHSVGTGTMVQRAQDAVKQLLLGWM